MRQVIWLCLVVILAIGSDAISQVPSAKTKRTTSPLGVRQQRVEQMLEDLERKFKTLADALNKTEPERAERLKQALTESKRMLLQDRMGQISQLLDQAQLESATADQKAVLADIRQLLELLLDEKSDRDKAREEYERLDKFRKQIEEVLKQERTEKRESDRISDKDETIANLEARIKAIEALIAKQKDVIATTEAARGEGVQAFSKVANAQDQLRKNAEQVAGEISRDAGDQSPKSSEPANKPSETPKDSERPAIPASPSDKPPANDRAPEPGERPLREAIGNQQRATKNLQQGKGKAAQSDEETALANLQQSLAELKKESSRIASLPPEHFEKLANRQNDIAAETGKIDQEMQKGRASDSPPSSEGGSGGGQQPTPGQKQVQQAQGSMQKAAGDLKKQEPADASRQQGKAIKELEDALREIEERLAQLREETQIEKLARLEARFREMLARQQQATAATAELEKKRQSSGGELKRSDRLAVGKISGEELALAEAAQQALDIIIDDGTSVVFPDIVEQLRDDLNSVARLLDDKRTDEYTSTLQQEIETTLSELIEALQQAQQQKQGSGEGGGGGGGEEPLLPGSAELKLLRSAQLRINRRTTALDAARTQDNGLDEIMKDEIQTLSQRQSEIGEMTVRILERTSGR